MAYSAFYAFSGLIRFGRMQRRPNSKQTSLYKPPSSSVDISHGRQVSRQYRVAGKSGDVCGNVQTFGFFQQFPCTLGYPIQIGSDYALPYKLVSTHFFYILLPLHTGIYRRSNFEIRPNILIGLLKLRLRPKDRSRSRLFIYLHFLGRFS